MVVVIWSVCLVLCYIINRIGRKVCWSILIAGGFEPQWDYISWIGEKYFVYIYFNSRTRTALIKMRNASLYNFSLLVNNLTTATRYAGHRTFELLWLKFLSLNRCNRIINKCFFSQVLDHNTLELGVTRCSSQDM
jgi:hypothetical protein